MRPDQYLGTKRLITQSENLEHRKSSKIGLDLRLFSTWNLCFFPLCPEKLKCRVQIQRGETKDHKKYRNNVTEYVVDDDESPIRRASFDSLVNGKVLTS